ncbi:hypothetical protein B0I35DRAFT_439889 [Stachybotrys elegans]|uniref:Uncharacterized protein n=1 Tax=Stachybotrys elegans TaxID=80388 RepID=A0A8K0SQ81_9HYPO|nr:hypothetical protein B0I35DRAFT_439889 [Stachybotrys elegans]
MAVAPSALTVALDLSHRLGWEFWLHDHAAITRNVLLELHSGESPTGDDSPQHLSNEIKKEAKKALEEKRKAMDLPKPDPKEHEALNKWWKLYWNEKRMETVAVGVRGNEVLIAANVKKRITARGIETGKDELPPENLGLHDGRHDAMIRAACVQYNKEHKVNYKYTLLLPERRPETKEQNSERHAEMQIYAYVRQQNPGGTGAWGIEAIGVSKPLCRSCLSFVKVKKIPYDANPRYYLNEPTVTEVKEIVERAQKSATQAQTAASNLEACRAQVRAESAKVSAATANYEAAARAWEAAPDGPSDEAKRRKAELLKAMKQAMGARDKAQRKLTISTARMNSARGEKEKADERSRVASERANMVNTRPEDFNLDVPPGHWLDPKSDQFGRMSARPILQPN